VHHRSEEATQVDVLEAVGHRLPAVYSNRFYATGGGLISYGPDFVDQFRHARWLGAIKPAAMSNIIQTRPHNRLRLKERARDTRRCIGSCLSSVSGCLSLWTAEPKASGEVISAPLSITRMIRNGEAYHATKAALARLRSRSTRSADYRNGYGCTARIEHLSLQNRATRVVGIHDVFLLKQTRRSTSRRAMSLKCRAGEKGQSRNGGHKA